MSELDAILTTLSAYIIERDNFHKEKGFAWNPHSMSGHVHWDNMINGYASTLFGLLPTMNLAQLEAFTELSQSRLNRLRMRA